jgi:predicted  nucleic acid-binding Zn-ribbon protein
MKKTVSLILALALIWTMLFSLTSCRGSDANVDELNAQIAELTEQINEANSKIFTLEAEKAAKTAEITNLKADIKVHEAEKALLEKEVADLEAEIARLQALMNGNSNMLLEEIAELEAQIDSLEAEVATLSIAKANLESEIAALNAQISSLDAEKATLTARIIELEASIAAKNNEIENLNLTVNTLTTEKNTLIAGKNALTAENSELKEENEELKALVEALRNCLKGIHTYANGACTTCAKEFVYSREGNYIYFGEYPQTIKADDVTITSTTDDRGYYLGSDRCYYARVTANPYTSGYTFSTGEYVIYETVYYFKVEPIRWRILGEENGEAFILCDSIIANKRFDDDSNNYAESEIRAWLNETFYKTAFSAIQQKIILTTEVDNSLSSTGCTSNSYICENTNDKVFLISCAEVTNSAYGFSFNISNADVARRVLTTDYSIATGASANSNGTCYWWLRTPCAMCSFCARGVNGQGYVNATNTQVDGDMSGVVPALRIAL